MKPDILVFAPSPSAAVMQQLDAQFQCHHVWSIPAAEQEAYVDSVAGRVRGIVTTGPLGVSAALAARLPQLEVVSLNSVGYDKVDLEALLSLIHI